MCLSFGLLASCADIDQSIRYGGIEPVRIEALGQYWQVYDKADEKRFLISITNERAFADGLRLGLTLTDEEKFAKAAAEFLPTKREVCRLREGKKIAFQTYEFQYSCS